MSAALTGKIGGGLPGHMDADGNAQRGLRFEIDLGGFVERHLCPCDHCREVSGAPIHDILVVKKAAFRITDGEDRLVTIKTKPRCRRQHLEHTGGQLTIYVDVEGFDTLVLVHMPTVDKKDQAKVPGPDRIVFIEDSTFPAAFWGKLGLPMYVGWVGHTDKSAMPVATEYVPPALA